MIGTDCEYFFYDDGSNLAVPAKDVLAGSPERVEIFKDIGSDIAPDGYSSFIIPTEDATLTEDGLALEVPVSPSDDVDALMRHLGRGLKIAWELADQFGLVLTSQPVVNVNPPDLLDHPELRVLGCSPDKCAWDQSDAGVPALDPRETYYRTAGSHVHFSVPNMPYAFELIPACDATLGLADVLLEHSPLGKKRRGMYGAAGKFRFQEWGVEYRTPASTMSASPKVTEAMLGLAKLVHVALELRGPDFGYDLWDLAGAVSCIQAINECDVDYAMQKLPQVLEAIKKVVPDYPKSSMDLLLSTGERGGIQNYIMEGWKC